MKEALKAMGRIVRYYCIYIGWLFVASFIVLIINSDKIRKSVSSEIMTEIINSQTSMIMGLVSIVTLISFYRMFRKRERNIWEVCSFRKTSITIVALSLIMVAGLILISASFIFLTQNIFKDYQDVFKGILEDSDIMTSFITLVIIVPIFEEVLYRGISIYELRKSMKIETAIVIQAVIFSIIHFDMAQSIYTLLTGLVFGLVYVYSGSIWANIIMHIAYNLIGIFGTRYISKFVSQNSTIALILGFIILGGALLAFYKKTRISSIDDRKIPINISHP